MTANITEIELIESLDFEESDACENMNTGCDNAGTWYVITVCNCVVLFCDDCVALCRNSDAVLNLLDAMGMPLKYQCLKCHTEGNKYPFYIKYIPKD
jgi:hypothetical protein